MRELSSVNAELKISLNKKDDFFSEQLKVSEMTNVKTKAAEMKLKGQLVNLKKTNSQIRSQVQSLASYIIIMCS